MEQVILMGRSSEMEKKKYEDRFFFFNRFFVLELKARYEFKLAYI